MDESKIIATYTEGINAVITVVKDMGSQIQSLTGTITHLNEKLVDLESSSAKQAMQIAELEARLNKNSSNSSKPPSGDGYGKKAPKNSREKSGKSTGGQLGHVGKTLEKVQTPNVIVEFKIQKSCDCGCNLEKIESIKKTRQVFDIPKPQMWVTEYVTYDKVCPECGKAHKTEFPDGVTQPTQYGENIQTLLSYFSLHQLIPSARTVEAIRDLTGHSISEGTLANISRILCKKVEGAVTDIKKQIIAAEVVHFDETGMRSEGKTKWMHVASTEALTYYEIHDKRGQQAAQDIGILANFNGTSVHDHWKPYYCFTDCTHAECNAHNLRYLKDIAENYHQYWASEMASLLIEMNRRVKDLKIEGFFEMPKNEIKIWQERYHAIIEKGVVEDADKNHQILNKKGKLMKSKALQLLLKLQNYDLETLAFMYDFNIPFDNNLAERDIRMQKLRQKISGCFRGKDGASVFCRIRSYLSTAKKNGINAMDAIARALKGYPFIPQVR
ncbi:transposase [Candidatus Desulfosporosinus infrequens]|uniref:Transposase n=1 Tax=Candidatus Desulfosporosinus infrequens TaxID=2043169 RepID=A0A2U3LMH3_9FIRM|nr:transposase [Candidatus Desulfosporosinus infrequens]